VTAGSNSATWTHTGRFRSTLALAATLLGLAVVALPGLAAPAKTSLTMTLGLGSTYDNNFLEYSDPALRDFESGAHPDRYSIETRDDLVWGPSLGLGWERREAHGRRHALRVHAEGDFHQRNGTADMHSAGISWRESFRSDRRLTVSWFTIPRFYFRQVLDEDATPAYSGLSRYRRAEFSLDIASLAWEQRLSRGPLIAAEYQFERRNYNDTFDERDSKLHQGDVAVRWDRLPHRTSIGAHGAYRASVARAEDGDETPGVAPDDADVSYHGMSLGTSGRWELARHRPWRVTADAAYELETRGYDSDRPADRFHFDRNDTRHTVEAGVRLSRPRFAIGGFYRFENNHARLATTTLTATDAGSFRRDQVGVSIEFSLIRRMKSASEDVEAN